jgi:mono/diheme cytochrome c family protein
MRAMKFCGVAVILLTVVAFAVAQDQSAPASDQKSSVTVKHVPIARTSSTSGSEMFINYCAVCHGKSGKGDGPAASALKVPPADLTTQAKRNGGKFDSAHVATVIRGQGATPAHGSQEMPVWGPLFSSISQGNNGEVQQRIANLVKYIESLQVK